MNISELDVFDSAKAAQDPLVREELLQAAQADGNGPALAHARSVIAKARAGQDAKA